jgi:hypothetical protein
MDRWKGRLTPRPTLGCRCGKAVWKCRIEGGSYCSFWWWSFARSPRAPGTIGANATAWMPVPLQTLKAKSEKSQASLSNPTPSGGVRAPTSPPAPAVPDLTRSSDIQLNKRVSLRGHPDRLLIEHRAISPSVRPTPAKPSGEHIPLGGFVLGCGRLLRAPQAQSRSSSVFVSSQVIPMSSPIGVSSE